MPIILVKNLSLMELKISDLHICPSWVIDEMKSQYKIKFHDNNWKSETVAFRFAKLFNKRGMVSILRSIRHWRMKIAFSADKSYNQSIKCYLTQ